MPYSAGTTTYSIDVVAYDSIEVTGQVAPLEHWSGFASADLRDGLWIGDFKPGEQFHIRGVRKDQPAEILFNFEGNSVSSVRLSAAQTHSNVDLGEITIPNITGDAQANVTMQNALNVWGPGGQLLRNAVTFIKSDGTLIFTYPVRRSDGKVAATLNTAFDITSPTLPPGTYYVAPGAYGGPIALMVLDAVRAGHQAALDSHNVPKFDAPGTMTFDAATARDAIIAATQSTP